MKKLFGLLIAAVMAFGMVACSSEKAGDSDVTSNEFKISVFDVTATTASVAILPTDTTRTYFMVIDRAKNILKMDYDTYATTVGTTSSSTLATGFFTASNLAFDANTEYAVCVFYVDRSGAHSKKPTIAYFKTKKVEPIETMKLKSTDAEYLDYTSTPSPRNNEYWWGIYAYNEDMTVNLILESQSGANSMPGTYDLADIPASRISLKVGMMWTDPEFLCDAHVTLTKKSNNKYHVSGYVVDRNMIRYNLDITAYPF